MTAIGVRMPAIDNVQAKRLTPREIRRCFTDAEMIAVLNDAKTNDATMLIVHKLETMGAELLDPDSPSMRAALDHLRARGLATAALEELLA